MTPQNKFQGVCGVFETEGRELFQDEGEILVSNARSSSYIKETSNH